MSKDSARSDSWLGLDGRVCVVTGAGSGIGAETANRLASQGAWVAILDRHEDAALNVAREIEAAGGRALGLHADVSDAQSVATAARKVRESLGPCRVLVNNAAVRHREPLMDISLEAWNKVLSVNLTGTLLCTKSFAAQMIEAGQGGSLIHIASVIARYPQGGSGPYCASKAGMITLSRTLTLELAPHRIRSNTVSPGMIRTPASESSYQDPDRTAARLRMIPSGRIGETEDLADVIAFLASDRSSYINGQDIMVNGGVDAALMDVNKRPLPSR